MTLTDRLLQAVYLLTTTRPHEDDDKGLSTRDLVLYSRGYYRALVAALRAMEFVVAQAARRRRGEREDRARVRAVDAGGARPPAARRCDVFVVRRKTDVGLITFSVNHRAEAMLWARFLRERWGEATWVEHVGFPAMSDAGYARLVRETARLARDVA